MWRRRSIENFSWADRVRNEKKNVTNSQGEEEYSAYNEMKEGQLDLSLLA